MRATPVLLSITSALVLVGAAAAQSTGSGEPGARALLPREREILLARSAAPSAVSDAAAVWVLGPDGYELAEAGSSGAACFVSRDWLDSLEPVCYDPEAARTIMRIGMRRVEMLHAGRPVAEVDRALERAIADGELPLPERVAVAWMQSSAQRLVSDDGTPVGAWRPHLMLYSPYLTAADLGFRQASAPEELILVDAGLPTSMMMIVVDRFVDPAGG